MTLESADSTIGARKQVDYRFHANQGPEVKVSLEGANISKNRMHLLIPIYQEGDDRQRFVERRGVQYSVSYEQTAGCITMR